MKKISFNEFNKKAYLKVLDEAVSIYDRVIPNLMKKGSIIREDYVSDIMIELEKEGFTRQVLNDTFLKVLDSKSKTLHTEPDYYDFIYLVSLFDKDIIRENITRMLDDPHIRYDESNRLMIRLINNDPELVFLKVKNDKRKYIVRGFSDNNFLFGDEIDTDSSDMIDNDREEEYIFRQILFQATYGTAKNMDNLFKVLRDKDLIAPLLDKDMFLVGRKNSSYIAFYNLYQAITNEELDKYNDKIMSLIKECKEEDMYKVCYKISKINALKKDKSASYYDSEDRVITGVIRSQGEIPKSMLKDNFNELIKLVSINRRSDLFLLALCDKDTNEEDLARSMYHLRREDIEVVIASLLRCDARFLLKPNYTLSNDYYLSRDKIDYLYLKDRLVRVLELNEELAKKDNSTSKSINKGIFSNIDTDTSKLMSSTSPYKSMLSEFIRREEQDSLYFLTCFNNKEKDQEVELNKKLLCYERLNLIKILAASDDRLKQKSIRNIIDGLVINRDLKEDDKIEFEKKVNINNFNYYNPTNKSNVSPFYYSHKETDMVYEKIYELVIREYYKDKLGLDITNIKPYINRCINPAITYGVEIEIVNIEKEYKAHKLCNDIFKTKTELTLKKINKDESKHMPNYYRTRPLSCEFITDILRTNNDDGIQGIYDEIKVLNHYGAEENCSCGFHIHVSSPKLIEYKEPKYNEVAINMAREVYNLQDLLIKKLCCYKSRLDKTAREVQTKEPDLISRYKIVNLLSISKHGTIEFRLFNMPDRLDPVVADSYIDFALCFYDKIEKGYNLSEILDEAAKYYEEDNKELDLDDYKFKVLLETLECKDETKLVLENLDDIFKFYTAKDILEEHGDELELDPSDNNSDSIRDRDNKHNDISNPNIPIYDRVINYYDDVNKSLMHELEQEYYLDKEIDILDELDLNDININIDIELDQEIEDDDIEL